MVGEEESLLIGGWKEEKGKPKSTSLRYSNRLKGFKIVENWLSRSEYFLKEFTTSEINSKFINFDNSCMSVKITLSRIFSIIERATQEKFIFLQFLFCKVVKIAKCNVHV